MEDIGPLKLIDNISGHMQQLSLKEDSIHLMSNIEGFLEIQMFILKIQSQLLKFCQQG
jgi:hypothetical protein